MKNILTILFLALILLATVVFPIAAFADGSAETVPVEAADAPAVDDDQVANQPYTWAYLATLAGATAATLLIVQFLKVPLDKVWRIPTRIFVYVVALAILLIAIAFTSGLTAENALEAAVNAFLVALTAYGTYEVTFAKVGK